MAEGRLRIAVLGGDRREAAAARYFLGQGAQVHLAGMRHDEALERATFFASAAAAVESCHGILTPVRGMDDDCRLYVEPGAPGVRLDDEVFRRVEPGAVFVVGQVGRGFRRLAAQYGVSYREILARSDFAILNSVPTAEGAIQIAMAESPLTLAGNVSLVLGHGRTGSTLARTLDGMGARVMVASRDPGELAHIGVNGYQAVPFDQLDAAIGHAEFIFNTVPAPVLTREILERIKPGAVIVDIASEPGGTDFQACGELGIRATHALGLPGKAAPETAGHVLGAVAERVIAEFQAEG